MAVFRAARVVFPTRCRAIVEAILLLACLVLSTELFADERTEYEIRIERQSLPEALSRLASQTDTSIFSVEARLSEIMVGPVAGTLSPEAALQQLLAGTGFIVTKALPGYEIRRASVIRAPRMPVPAPGSFHDGRATMTVWGARIDSVNGAPASTIFDASLDQAGVSTVGELLTYLPQQPYVLPESVWGDGAQYADLRGFGPDMTTVLINGRWVPSSATSGVAFDLNTLPIAAVERLEVFTDASDAPGGQRAIGGVVDIQLKRAARSPTARVEYGTAAGGGTQHQAVLTAGAAGSKLTSGVVLEYFERSELPGAAREFWRDQDFSRFGGSDYRSLASWPGNISSSTGAALPGLPSSYASVPLDTAGANPTISDFQSTAGTYQLDSLRRYSSIVPAARRLSVVANTEASFQHFSAFAELLGVDRLAEYQFAPPTLTNVLVPAGNAFNPFGEAVYASRLLHEIGPRRVVTNSQLLRVVAGMRGALNAWDWEVTALGSEESASRWANNVLDDVRVATALASSDPNQALNIFQEGPVGSPEIMASLVAPPAAVELRSAGSELAATLSGPVTTLPAGDVTASLGAHWRRETTSSTRTISSGHAELHLPLWTDQLAANLSTSFDHFSDIGSIVTPHYAVTWQPLEELQLRWSHGRVFRAPSTYELSGPRYDVETMVSDRRRNGEPGTITAYVGSSPHLQSVQGESTAVSVRVTPSQLTGLEMSASYWLKRINHQIVSVPLTLILDHEAAFADRVYRDLPTPDDLAAGRPGALRAVDLSLFNVGRVEARGMDAAVSYRFNRELEAQLSATWMDDFASVDVPGGAATDRVGVANPRGTIPRWRAIAAVHWNSRPASASLIARYVAPYEDAVGNLRTGRRVSSQTSVDLQASLDLGNLAPTGALLRGVSLTAGAINIFDTPPQFSPSAQDLGYDPSLSDPRQRFGYLRMQKRF